jgi:rhomboid family GlyGly-CTERM serine protease
MDLGRLMHADARHLRRAPLALAVVLIAMQWFGTVARDALPYDRVAILSGGEYSRLVTGHLYHHDLVHLAWNLGGLALVAWLFVREYTTGQWCVILAVSTVAVDLGFLLLQPQLEWYVGFSGVLHGLMTAGLVRAWWWHRDPVTLGVAVALVLKLGWEHLFGALPFTEATLSLPVIHAAHTYGAVGGAAAAAWIGWRQPRPARSL